MADNDIVGRLTAATDRIDDRLAPISGREADSLAQLLREAANHLISLSAYDPLRKVADHG